MTDQQFNDEVNRLIGLGYDRPTAERIAAVALSGHGDVIQTDDAGNTSDFDEQDDLGWSDPNRKLPNEEDKDVRPPEPPGF